MKTTVMIAEDEPLMRERLLTMLERCWAGRHGASAVLLAGRTAGSAARKNEMDQGQRGQTDTFDRYQRCAVLPGRHQVHARGAGGLRSAGAHAAEGFTGWPGPGAILANPP